MKSIAIVILFHRYDPKDFPTYKILFEWFLRFNGPRMFYNQSKLEKRFYIVDSNKYLLEDREPLLELFPGTHIISTQNTNHAENVKMAFDVIEEDYMMLMDMDTLISQDCMDEIDSIVQGKNPDIFSMFEATNDHVITRFSPYLFIASMSFLRTIQDIDFGEHYPDLLDPLSVLTRRIMRDHGSFKFIPIKDDRLSYSLNEETNDVESFWEGEPLPRVYHIRNFNAGIRLLDTFLIDKKGYADTQRVMPYREKVRILAWFATLLGALPLNEKMLTTFNRQAASNTLEEVLEDMEVPRDAFSTLQVAYLRNYASIL